jgi:hypothetical protein
VAFVTELERQEMSDKSSSNLEENLAMYVEVVVCIFFLSFFLLGH